MSLRMATRFSIGVTVKRIMLGGKRTPFARITLLSTLDDGILREFKDHQRAMELWIALKNRFGTCSTARLRSLTIKFDSYKKRPEHSMKTHLRQMTNMIGKLKDAGHVLTDEQQIQAVIHSLPSSWDHMKMHLTHNERITTLEDVQRHLELEKERLEAAKTIAELRMATTSKNKGDQSERTGERREGHLKLSQLSLLNEQRLKKERIDVPNVSMLLK
ncbi:uncharacterized protein LOC132058335 [Lycium ferocissimum]|uniref:uncharacterized protein LOC132058335 n=1 Tax=Lycium ferocissimum TaxID=112874 RepID=UPI0028155C3B|nr:uncharacterized protein LOC132058335 [Lycium ferocissimum]XP_059306855.1 uncharacterized protein LOC132058335 [Lycium ferocissimum]